MKPAVLVILGVLLGAIPVRGEEITVLPPPPGRLLAPDNGEVIAGPIEEKEFSWTIVEGARRYHLEIADDRNFYRVIRDIYSEDNRETIGRLPFGTYYWRVSSLGGRGMEGRFTSSHYFVYVDRGEGAVRLGDNRDE